GTALVPVGTALVPVGTALVPVGTALVPVGTALVPVGTALVPVGTALVPVDAGSGAIRSALSRTIRTAVSAVAPGLARSLERPVSSRRHGPADATGYAGAPDPARHAAATGGR
ncbi:MULTISPECIES: hypothetical protein, partial [Nocardia]|uniref:hypothetical protein n=1 Tax=Nocardia TaxID=1817 RepID=UPI001F0DC0FA